MYWQTMYPFFLLTYVFGPTTLIPFPQEDAQGFIIYICLLFEDSLSIQNFR